ncbi:TPA: collagen-like protein, partial [Streptococcus pyogenes]|nr:collagen-like protein [Streptococcus pyogenes]
MLTSKHHNLNKLIWRYGLTSAAAVLLAFGGGASSVKAENENSETARAKLLERLNGLQSQHQNDVPQTESIEEKLTLWGSSIYDSAELYKYLEKIEDYLEKQKKHEEEWKKEITAGLKSGALRGERGEAGPKGPQGEKGVPGVQGPKGQDGAQGERGPAGPKGEDGKAGARGAQGPAGPRGERGEQGLQGEKGETGAAGAPGKDGAPG